MNISDEIDYSVSIAVGDFNKDGDLDVVVVNEGFYCT